MSWMDEYDQQRPFREIQRELHSLKVQMKDMQILLMEIRGFVEYVDQVAPELRTAYHVSKRME